MPATCVQVGSWVTIRAASRRARDRRDAQTPGLVSQITIEGAASAVVLYPNPLALQFGFKGQGWRRLTNVSFDDLVLYTGPCNTALEAALLTSLRSLRSERFQDPRDLPRKRSPCRSLTGPVSESGEPTTKRLRSSDLDSSCDNKRSTRTLGDFIATSKSPTVPTIDDSPTFVSVSDPDSGPAATNVSGLRKWMRPGSVWEDAISASAAAPFGVSPAAGQQWTDLQDAALTGKGHRANGSGDLHVFSSSFSRGTTTDIVEQTTDPGCTEDTGAAQSEDLDGVEIAECNLSFRASGKMEEGAGEAVPLSPQQPCAPTSPSVRSEWTPSPRRLPGIGSSALDFSPQRPICNLQLGTFTAAVASAFKDKSVPHIRKTDLFEHVCAAVHACKYHDFEAKLTELDSLDKIAVIDDLVFSLA